MRAFFGDNFYDFKLTAPLLIELERKTGAGIGALCSRVFARQFSQTDITETIRIAAIGGGMDAKRAAELVATYGERPLTENYTLAAKILQDRMFGPANEKTNGQA